MPSPTSTRGSALLVLAQEVAAVHAEVGDDVAHGYLAAAVDALAHALVDLADGASEPSTSTPLAPLPGRPGAVGALSCSAAAATLHRARGRVLTAVTGSDGIPPGLAPAVVGVCADLAEALQRVADPDRGPEDRRARLRRDLLSAHRRLQRGGTVPG